jgi:hypothetical protein
MKKKIKLIFMLVSSIVCCHATEAQLLKKLKEKAEKSLDGKNSSTASSSPISNSSTDENTSNDITTNSSKKVTEPSKAPSNGQLVFSLEEGERLFYDESRIVVLNNALQYSFITYSKKYEYFLIENGKRTGPFKTSPIKSLQESEDENTLMDDEEINFGGGQSDPVAVKYSKTIGGKLYIVFNGKNFGPYDHVSKMIVSPDQKYFFALVTIGGDIEMTAKMGMGKSFMVNDGTLKLQAGTSSTSIPMRLMVSENFKHCMSIVMNQADQQMLLSTSAGKTTSTSMADMLASENSILLVSDKGDIINVPSQSPTQILVNGEEAASFKVPIKSASRLFIQPDIKKTVYYEGGKLYKADGTEENMSGVVFPKVLSLNNETAMYYYKIHTNASGTKDVYLCKTVL